MSNTSEPSKPAASPDPSPENDDELTAEQLDEVSGGIIIINSRDAALGGPDTTLGPSPHMTPDAGLLTPKVGG